MHSARALPQAAGGTITSVGMGGSAFSAGLAFASEGHYRRSTVEMDAFAAMTRRVIASDGFDRYLPTACYPERRVLRVLEDAPDTEQLEVIALEWALSWLEGAEEVLVAFKVDAAHFKVIRRAADLSEECVYSITEASALLS